MIRQTSFSGSLQKKQGDLANNKQSFPKQSMAWQQQTRTWLTARDRNPSEWIAVWWTKISSVPSSGTMKPNPFLTSNHLTVPDVMLSEKHRIAKGVLILVASLLTANTRWLETRAADLIKVLNMFADYYFDWLYNAKVWLNCFGLVLLNLSKVFILLVALRLEFIHRGSKSEFSIALFAIFLYFLRDFESAFFCLLGLIDSEKRGGWSSRGRAYNYWKIILRAQRANPKIGGGVRTDDRIIPRMRMQRSAK